MHFGERQFVILFGVKYDAVLVYKAVHWARPVRASKELSHILEQEIVLSLPYTSIQALPD